MTTWAEYQLKSFEASKAAGWWEECLGNELPGHGPFDSATLVYAKVQDYAVDKLGLIHSEASEALEDYRVGHMKTVIRDDGKPTGFGSELGDVCIRGWDLIGALESVGVPGPTMPSVTLDRVAERLAALSEVRGKRTSAMIGILHKVFSSSLIGDRVDPRQIAAGVGMALEIGCLHGFDMEYELDLKMAYNKTRSHRHGNKRC